MLYYLLYVIGRKIGKTVGWRKKKLPSFSRCRCHCLAVCCLVLLSWHNVHRQSGWHCAKCDVYKGGFDRGDVKNCCQPKRGKVVRGSGDKFLCVFCPPKTLVVCWFWFFPNVWFFEEENSCHTLDYCAPFCMCLRAPRHAVWYPRSDPTKLQKVGEDVINIWY